METYYKYLEKFGLLSKTGIDLPGEAKGIVKSVDKVSEADLATIAFGQTNTVNSVQYMSAFNAVANGGTLIQPHVMKEVTHNDENNVILHYFLRSNFFQYYNSNFKEEKLNLTKYEIKKIKRERVNSPPLF